MAVGSPGIVAVNSYDAMNMAPVKNTHQYCKHWRFRCRFLSAKQLILHKYTQEQYRVHK